MKVDPVLEEMALIAENEMKVLVLADFHLGVEYDFHQSGVIIPSQTQHVLDRALKCIRDANPDRILLLGDVKHNVPRTSWQEQREIPEFLQELAEHAPIDIISGNHDGGLHNLLPSDTGKISIHSSKGLILDGVGYLHGHAWPNPDIFASEQIIMAHNHPVIRLTDTVGYTTTEPVWVRSRLRYEVISDHYSKQEVKWEDPVVTIMPAFNRLCGGIPFNLASPSDLLGPICTSGALDLELAELYMTDGTSLGIIRNMRIGKK